MASGERKSAVERAADEIINDIEAMCSIRCQIRQYKAALERIQEHIEASIEAAKDDIRRLEEEG